MGPPGTDYGYSDLGKHRVAPTHRSIVLSGSVVVEESSRTGLPHKWDDLFVGKRPSSVRRWNGGCVYREHTDWTPRAPRPFSPPRHVKLWIHPLTPVPPPLPVPRRTTGATVRVE